MTPEELYQEYLRTVIRTRDGQPIISFRQWCFSNGIILY